MRPGRLLSEIGRIKSGWKHQALISLSECGQSMADDHECTYTISRLRLACSQAWRGLWQRRCGTTVGAEATVGDRELTISVFSSLGHVIVAGRHAPA